MAIPKLTEFTRIPDGIYKITGGRYYETMDYDGYFLEIQHIGYDLENITLTPRTYLINTCNLNDFVTPESNDVLIHLNIRIIYPSHTEGYKKYPDGSRHFQIYNKTDHKLLYSTSKDIPKLFKGLDSN